MDQLPDTANIWNLASGIIRPYPLRKIEKPPLAATPMCVIYITILSGILSSFGSIRSTMNKKKSIILWCINPHPSIANYIVCTTYKLSVIFFFNALGVCWQKVRIEMLIHFNSTWVGNLKIHPLQKISIKNSCFTSINFEAIFGTRSFWKLLKNGNFRFSQNCKLFYSFQSQKNMKSKFLLDRLKNRRIFT